MSGKNVVASVLARLKNVADANRVAYGEILTRYAIERTLKRIEMSTHASKCILKGGTLFILWTDGFGYRPTMDADLEFRGDGSPESLRQVFRDVAATGGEEDDGLRINSESISAMPIREDDQYGGVRVSMTAYIGRVRIPLQFDVGVGDAITPVPKKSVFPVLIGGSAPNLRVYPRETVVSEKFETIVKRGLANSRMKDYYDLWVMSRDSHVDKGVAQKAIERTFERRKTPIPMGVPFGLTDDFSNNELKITQWNAFLRKNRLDAPALVDVVGCIRAFITEIVGA